MRQDLAVVTATSFILFSVPGQWTLVWQSLDRRCSPGQGRPPWMAAGLLHFLSDTWSPTPQVTGQEEKGVHALQPPSTET